jgi:hypothetical protein
VKFEMKKILVWFVLIVTACAVGFFLLKGKVHEMSNSSTPQKLFVGFPATWGGLVPATQHTAFANALLHNVFECLVRNRLGVIEPLAAKSWTVSADRKIFTFEIDSLRKFSNGEKLTAQHFKKAWEDALRFEKKSSNKSLLDVIYKIEGFSDFEKKGEISGVRVHSDTKLEVVFASPFRSALEELAAARYAAAIYTEKGNFGTGAYVLEKDEGERAEFSRNPFWKDETLFDQVEVRVVDPSSAEKLLRAKELDAYYYMRRGGAPNCNDDEALECLSGAEAGHEIVNLNAMAGRFFEDRELRLAFQTLVWKVLREKGLAAVANNPVFRFDPQFYLPFQAGRLTDEDAEKRIAAGESAIKRLISASEKNPVYAVTNRGNFKLFEELQAEGLVLDKRSRVITLKEAISIAHKTREADVFFIGASVNHGDPDGAYHLLGKNGSIGSPMIHREKVADLLETGREILEIEKLHPFYQQVGAAILEEVPFVHVGMTSDQIAFRKEKVQSAKVVLGRAGNDFAILRKRNP